MIPISQGFVSVLWAPRREEAAACARRLVQCLEELRAASPLLSGWLHVRRKGRLKVLPDPVLLGELLLAGQQKTDSPPRRIIEELGYGSSFITDPKQGEPLTLSVNCGVFTPRVLNQCLIEFAAEGEKSYAAVPQETKDEVLKALIRAWEPSWGSIGRTDLRQAARTQHGIDLGLSCGEVTFVGADRPSLPDLKDEWYQVEDFLPYGRLIRLRSDSAEDKLSAVVQLRIALDNADVFYRFPPAAAQRKQGL